jgi:hypothetical protein
MGVIKRGILGGFSGKVANVIGGSWKGIAYMRAMPLSVANPRTTAQTTQRTIFADILAVLKLHLSVIKQCNDRWTALMSGFNAVMSRAIKAYLIDSAYFGGSFHFSIGKLTNGVGSGFVFSGATTIICTWTDEERGSYDGADDNPFVFVYNNSTKDAVAIISGDKVREDGTASFDITDCNVENGQKVRVCFGFRRADGTEVSTSWTSEKTYTT